MCAGNGWQGDRLSGRRVFGWSIFRLYLTLRGEPPNNHPPLGKPQGCGEYPSRGYLVPETHADRAVSFPEALLHSRRSQPASCEPHGCGEYPSRGYLVQETQERFPASSDTRKSFTSVATGFLPPATLVSPLHRPWQSDVGTRAPRVGALRRRRSSCRGAVSGRSEGEFGAVHSGVLQRRALRNNKSKT